MQTSSLRDTLSLEGYLASGRLGEARSLVQERVAKRGGTSWHVGVRGKHGAGEEMTSRGLAANKAPECALEVIHMQSCSCGGHLQRAPECESRCSRSRGYVEHCGPDAPSRPQGRPRASQHSLETCVQMRGYLRLIIDPRRT